VLLINKTTWLSPFHSEILDLSKNCTYQTFLSIFPEISVSKYIGNNPYFKEKISSQTCVMRLIIANILSENFLTTLKNYYLSVKIFHDLIFLVIDHKLTFFTALYTLF